MGRSVPAAAREGLPVPPPRSLTPVPAPPSPRPARLSGVQQTPPSARREHEVQRLIRDLASLAATHRPRIS
jgi:hypothetical protein